MSFVAALIEIVQINKVYTQLDNPTFTGTAKDNDGTVLNITGATIELLYWFEGDEAAVAKIAGSVVSGAAGTFSAKFASGIPNHGIMHFVWRLTESGGDVFHSTKEWVVPVRKRFRQVA